MIMKRQWKDYKKIVKFGKKLKIVSKKFFDSKPVYNEKYLKAKIKSYKEKINTNFCNNKIPKKGFSIYLFISNFDRFYF